MIGKFVNGTVLRNKSGQFFYYNNGRIHFIEFDEYHNYKVLKCSIEVTDTVEQIEDIIEIDRYSKFVPYDKALIGYKVVRKNDDKIDHELNVKYTRVINIDYDFQVTNLYCMRSIPELHTFGYPQTEARDYIYFKVKIWGIINIDREFDITLESTCMEFIEKLNPLEVLYQSIGNNGSDQFNCYFVDEGWNNNSCRYSRNLRNSVYTRMSMDSGSLYDCDNVVSSFLNYRCELSQQLMGCIEVIYSQECIFCHNTKHLEQAVFNKVVSDEEYKKWEEFYWDFDLSDFNDVYEVLDPELIEDFIKSNNLTVSINDVIEYRDKIKEIMKYIKELKS